MSRIIPGLLYGRTVSETLHEGKMHPYLEVLWIHSLRDPDAIYDPRTVAPTVMRTTRMKLQRPSTGFDAAKEGLTSDDAVAVILDFLRTLPLPLMADNVVTRRRRRSTFLSKSATDLTYQPDVLAWMDPADFLMLKYIIAFIRIVGSDPVTREYNEDVVDRWVQIFYPVLFGDPNLTSKEDSISLANNLASMVYDPGLMKVWVDTTTPRPGSPSEFKSPTNIPDTFRPQPLPIMEEFLRLQDHGILVQGGVVVNDDGMFEADVFIKEGQIQTVAQGIGPPARCLVINAKNKYVIPGGIDPHTHLQLPFMSTVSVDDFYHGTLAALAGGTTTILDFAIGKKGQSLIDVYNLWREWADPKVCCDYGLHIAVVEWDDRVEDEMEYLVKQGGINSFKLFLAYKDSLMVNDDEMYEIFRKCREIGSVPMVHAENGNIIAMNQKYILASGITGPEGHEQSRPEEVEAEAVHRAIVLASQVNSPLYIVHVMSKSATKEIINANKKVVLYGETLAATLATDGTNYYNKCWCHAAGHILSPPLRPDPTTPDAMMDYLASDGLQLVGSDHCTFTLEQKKLGKDDFRKIPNGVNGIESRMRVVWQKGVNSGKIDPKRFVAITSTNAAKIFNLYPQKGCIAAGSDADVVIWDPDQEHTISAKTHHLKTDFNVFEGMKCRGGPLYVISKGKLIVNAGALNVTKGDGRFLFMNPCSDYVYDRVKELEKKRIHKKIDRQST